MAIKLKIRSVENEDARLLATPDVSELLVRKNYRDNDGDIKVFVGDGETPGGVEVGSDLQIATAQILGGIKPDGVSVVVNSQTGVAQTQAVVIKNYIS